MAELFRFPELELVNPDLKRIYIYVQDIRIYTDNTCINPIHVDLFPTVPGRPKDSRKNVFIAETKGVI